VRRALIPGSFDPPTTGHLDMIRRTARLFDEVYVVVFDNSRKNNMFAAPVRLELIKLACVPLAGCKDMGRIIADMSQGMLCDYAAEHNIDAVIKGARGGVDFDYEYPMSLVNRSLNPDMETLIMPSRAEYQHISSTAVRELLKYGKPLDGYVPDEIKNRLSDILNKK
jgi:pantetheine-phosphate adenylyltransferase